MANNFAGRIGKLLEIGLDSEDILGYHGTSVDSIIRMSQSGKLPPGRADGLRIFFVPAEYVDAGYHNADGYAWTNARAAYVFNELACSDEDYQDIWELYIIHRLRDGAEEEYARLLRKIGKKYNASPEELERILNACDNAEREGCILTLSKRMAQDLKVDVMPAPRNNPADNTYVDVGQRGLDINYVTGIEPLSQYEWDILQQFQEE